MCLCSMVRVNYNLRNDQWKMSDGGYHVPARFYSMMLLSVAIETLSYCALIEKQRMNYPASDLKSCMIATL